MPDVHHLPGHSHNPLAAFCYYPDRVDFVEKDPQEKVVLLLRKHPITNVPWIITAILSLLLPVFVTFFEIFEFIPLGFQIVAIIGWYLVTIAYAYEKFLNWFFNVNIITDERVFDVDFINLVYREITDANIDQIQDVTVRIGSAIRTIFNYGDISIQTAAEIPEIEFEAVPKPDQVAKILRDLRVEEEHEKLEGRVR
ncbi:PH domain-containing protein [Candidatus Woesebacteria bacterium]|nr:PH domain-containing protein [Candidatus Woesebacteria bacterium]